MKFSGRRSIVSLLLLSTMLVGSAAAASPASAAMRGPSNSERRIAWLINQARKHDNRATLRYSLALSRIARAHSLQMARAGTIYHTKNLAYAFRNLSWRIGGENVGMGPSMDALHAAFMASLHHRENNLDKRFRSFGIGVIWRRGIAYVTVQFLG